MKFSVLLPIVAALGFAGPPSAWGAEWPTDLKVEKIENGNVHFLTPEGASPIKPLETRLHDVKYIGILPAPEGGASYLLLSGLPCAGCEDRRNLHLIQGYDKVHATFVHPGKVTDRKTRALLYDGRAFFGECLKNGENVYIAFQAEKVDRRRYLQHSVFVATVGKDRIYEKLHTARSRPNQRHVLARVKRKLCTEIPGERRLSVAYVLPSVKPEEEDEEATP